MSGRAVYLTQWERSLLSFILSAYQSADFNCGADDEELQSVNCPKCGNNDIHLDIPCIKCRYYERFEKMMSKVQP